MEKEQGLTEVSTQMDGLTRQTEKLRGPKALSPAPRPIPKVQTLNALVGSVFRYPESQQGSESLPHTL